MTLTPAAQATSISGGEMGIQWVNTVSITLNITFSSGNAICEGKILGKTDTAKIEATFKLLKKNASGTFVPYYTWPKVTVYSDYLIWSGTCAVDKGVYRLQVDGVVTNNKGVAEPVSTYVEKEYK